MKIYISHASNYDFQKDLYGPLKLSTIPNEHELFFPHDAENIDTHSKDLIASSDLMLAEVSSPSTGQGIEMGWSNASNTPIVCLFKKGSHISSSLRFVAEDFIEYTDSDDMVEKLKRWLNDPNV